MKWLARLGAAGLEARKTAPKEGLVDVDIDSSQVAKAVTILQADGLPREHHANLGEVFRKDGLISSPLEERARYVWALSEELAATINLMDGVVKARVHVVLPERSDTGDTTQPAAAAVFIKTRAGANLQSALPQIKQLVSNSIPGLEAERVTVVLVAAQPLVPGEAAAPGASAAEANGVGGAHGNGVVIGIVLAALALLGALGWLLRGRIAGALGRGRKADESPVKEAAR